MRFIRGISASVGRSLKLKLILFIAAILGLTIGIAPWSAIKMQERQLLQFSSERLRSLHEMLKATVVATCMLSGDRESVQKVFETLSNRRDIRKVRIFDRRGVILYSSYGAERGERLSSAELSRYYGQADPVVLTGGGNVTHTLVQPIFNHPKCFSCHVPEQKVLGVLQVSLPLDETWRQLATLKRSAVLATLITLGVIVIGIWLSLTLLIDRPLRRLVEAMSRAKQGDLGARADIRNKDELGQLARHFDGMLAKLDDAQQELEQYHQQQLAQADRLATIGEMAAAIAHEIRNPLTGISGALSVLSRGFPAEDPRREIVHQTHLLIDRLNRSVEDILHYTRPSRPQFQVVKLDDIVDRALSLVEGEARKAQVRIVKKTASEAGGESPAVNADPQQIQQVLMNLTLNSIHATAAGGQIWVRTRLSENHRRERRACVEVEDSGKGMTPEQAEKAFQPFFSTKAQGSGLGLSIAKQIVEQHDGEISLRSAPGGGTRVRVELPACPQESNRGA